MAVVPEHRRSRRDFLGLAQAAAAGLVVPAGFQPSRAEATGATAAAGLSGATNIRMAMHVHGSWSEGPASWQAQFAQAAAHGIDLLYLTDHDHRATAWSYLTSIVGVPLQLTAQGTFAQQLGLRRGEGLRLLNRSSGSGPTRLTLAVPPESQLRRSYRTSISGHRLRHEVAWMRCAGGGTYEVVVQLSFRPATAGRPAGRYFLRYRFGQAADALPAVRRFLEGDGLTGVVLLPVAAAGSVQEFDLEQDVAALWPDLLALDNSLFGLSFVANSPGSDSPVDVAIGSLGITRTRSAVADVIADQARVVAAYQQQYPAVTGWAHSEVSLDSPHLNAFASPQYLPDLASLPRNELLARRAVINEVHALGGLLSWNHPFGTEAQAPLAPAEQAARRREVFLGRQAAGLTGVDLIEIGYELRAGVSARTHLDLWDTCSRQGIFLTGNGVNDDHAGDSWANQTNTFFTGARTMSAGTDEVISALASGKAYFASLRDWPEGEIDLLIDHRVPMGGVSVSPKVSRPLTVSCSALPPGGVLQVIAGPVDFAGAVDPGTIVLWTWTAAELTGGTVTIMIEPGPGTFVRAQVLTGSGQIVGASNPIWLLRQWPASGVPQARQARV